MFNINLQNVVYTLYEFFKKIYVFVILFDSRWNKINQSKKTCSTNLLWNKINEVKKNLLKFFFDFIIFSYMIFECFAYNNEILYRFEHRNFTYFIKFIDDMFKTNRIDKLFEKW